MKTKNTITLYELYKEIHDDYYEWLEMGYPLDDLALSLLRKEREKSADLQMKIDYLEKRLNS